MCSALNGRRKEDIKILKERYILTKPLVMKYGPVMKKYCQ